MSCSPGEVVVFQCVEWLKGYVQDRLPQQDSSEEEKEEKEGERSAGNSMSVDKIASMCQLASWCVALDIKEMQVGYAVVAIVTKLVTILLFRLQGGC